MMQDHSLMNFGLATLAAAALSACEIEVESPPKESPGFYGDHGSDWSGAAPPRPVDPPRGYEPATNLPASPGDSSEPHAPDAVYEPSLLPSEHRDLIVIDPQIVNGRRSSSTHPDAAWSFRAQLSWLAGARRDPFAFSRSWLEQWAEPVSIGSELAPVPARPRARALLIEPWLSTAGVPALSASSDAGALGAYAPLEPGPSWAQAPFRLIAIVNRVDLAAGPCSGFAGELRYVYSALEPVTERDLDMTLIVEVPYPASRPARGWAEAWSELAALPAGEAYEAALEELTREVQREGDPLRARVRSNELALARADAPSWELREFALEIQDGQLELQQVPLEFTPRADVDPALLAQHVLDHADQIRTHGQSLPEPLRAGAAEVTDVDFSWEVLGVSEGLRQAFSVQTCNGCHGGDTETLPFRHIGPGLSAARPARLSRFLYDPEAPNDELRRRSERLDALRDSSCEAQDSPEGYPGD